MNPVISAQATVLCKLLKAREATSASMFMEQTHLPFDVQDLVLAALSSIEKLDDEIIEEVLELCCAESGFNERILH